MSESLEQQLRSQKGTIMQLLKLHLRFCEECQDSVAQDRKANCAVGVQYTVRVVQIDTALAEIEKAEIEGAKVNQVVFTEDSVILRGEN